MGESSLRDAAMGESSLRDAAMGESSLRDAAEEEGVALRPRRDLSDRDSCSPSVDGRKVDPLIAPPVEE